jgi:hypothetical protein
MSQMPTTTPGATDPRASRGLQPSLVTTWDDQRDEAFFRCVAALFTPAYTAGATVLLASYDHDELVTV